MELYEKGIKKYFDGSIRTVYQFDSLKSCNELKGFLLSIQNKFGDVQDIIVKRYVSDNKVLFYKRYNDLYDFLEKFDLPNVQEYNTYEFLCNGMHCKIDSEKDIIDIYHSVNITESESDNYEYYKFSSGLIVRYNNDSGRCYYLDDDNKWICKLSLQSMIDDAAYAYEIIDDPLKEISAEELERKHNEKKAGITQRFKDFCCEIEFIEM